MKFGKAPFVDAFRLARLTNPVEVFENDPLIVRLGLGHDFFADAVVGVRDETPLTARDTLERLLRVETDAVSRTQGLTALPLSRRKPTAPPLA